MRSDRRSSRETGGVPLGRSQAPAAPTASASSGWALLKSGALLVLLPAALLWSYWPTIDQLIQDWRTDDNYSVGALVPLAAAYLLWHTRGTLAKCRPTPCWWGVGVVLVAQAARAFGLLFFFKSAERYSLVLTVVGLVLFVAGRQVTREIRWILLFLFLMVPLPGRVHDLIAVPLQSFATAGAYFTLELFGIPVIREGNVLHLDGEVAIAVAEACSGLRMLTSFVIVAATLAYLVNRPRWQKAALVLSSVPVAILCNQIRLLVTSVLFLVASSEIAERFFHDFAGLTMMPLAVLVLLAELWIMSRLVLDEPAKSRG